MANRQLTWVLQHLRHLIRQHAAGAPGDNQLLDRFIRERDEAAFEVLVWRHGPMVLSLCHRLLRNPHDAEDVLQATFLTLVRKAGSIGKRESLGSWLYKVAYRIALRARAEAAKSAAGVRPVEEIPAADAADEAAWRELRPLLDAAIQRLPEKYRTPIVLFYLQGKTNREVAEQLGCPVGTVTARLTRARELLRRHLSRRGVTLPAGALGALLSHHAVSATVGAPLAAAAVGAASLFAAGRAGAAGVVSAKVTHLVEEASRAMFLTKLQIALVMLAAVGVLAAGAGVLLRQRADLPPDVPPARAEEPPAKANLPPAGPAVPEKKDGETVAVTGRVLDPDGKPVAGARLYWPVFSKDPAQDDVEPPVRGRTDAEGKFRLELPRAEDRPDTSFSDLAAAADGYGVIGVRLPKDDPPAELTLKLAKDQPIRGRIVTLEGKPVAGLRVSVLHIQAMPNDRIDEFLATWKVDWQKAQGQRRIGASTIPGSGMLGANTDRDGRFEIRGVGAERLALLDVRGPGVVRTTLYVVTRPGLDLKPYNEGAQPNTPRIINEVPRLPPLLYGPTFDYVALADYRIEGTLREAVTGKPVAGVRLLATGGGAPERYGVSFWAVAVTDEQGRYRITGLHQPTREWNHHTIMVEPNPKGVELNPKAPWLRRTVRVSAPEGGPPLRADLELARGVVITGRVIDRATGKGVQSNVRFAPLPDNPYLSKPGFEAYRDQILLTKTDGDGKFELLAMPGLGVLLVPFATLADPQIKGGLLYPYKLVDYDPADRKRVGTVKVGPRGKPIPEREAISLENANAYKLVDVAPEGPVAVGDLFVDPGMTVNVQIQDPDGKPLQGAVVTGMTPYSKSAIAQRSTFLLADASCTIYALEPEQPRQILFLHPGRNLAGTLTVRGDEKEPPVAKLVPAGSVTGRLLDPDGQPLVGIVVIPEFTDQIAYELYSFLHDREELVRTDQDGRFHLPSMVPDRKFGLTFRKPSTSLIIYDTELGYRQVSSGQTLDLGDVRTKPVQQ